MMGKRDAETGRWIDSCLDKLRLGEPFFVLRAQDATAPITVRRWAHEAQRRGTPQSKVDEALANADAMEEWARLNGGAKVPD